ncbi:hypothetical protein M1N23_02835 [Dehalococcoidia bacterium]|nr:hypothetical protein [Dehalococcoidia bacterium]
MKQLSQILDSLVSSLVDALPPYRIVEGPLSMKESDQKGLHYINVTGSRVRVDEATFNILDVGEIVKVRFTRSGIAINIDRYVPLNDTGENQPQR